MSIINNLINFNIKNMIKLFRQGKISKLYSEMYSIAEEFAIHEVNIKKGIIMQKLDKRLNPNEYFGKYIEKISDYRDKRLNYHMNEMKKLLEMGLKDEKTHN